MQIRHFSVSWPKCKASLEMTVAMRVRNSEIDKSCLGGDLIYRLALFLKRYFDIGSQVMAE